MTRPTLAHAALVATLALSPLVPTAINAQSDTPTLQPAIDSTVRVRVPDTDREGTGWVISAADPVNRAGAGVVVTALSVIGSAKTILVREPTVATDYKATVLGVDEDRNLAFLEVKDIQAKPIPIGGTAKVGSRVFALGYSREADDSEQSMAANATTKAGSLGRELRGAISSEARAPVNQIEHDAKLVPGFEGGPLLDSCAALIGVDIKSAGPVIPRDLLRIRSQASVMNALKSDEVVKAARAAGVEPTLATGCGDTGATAGAAGAAGAATLNTTDTSEGESSGGGGLPTSLLVVLGLLGLVAAAFGIYSLTRRDPAMPDLPPETGPTPPAQPSRMPTGSVEGTALMGDTRAITSEKTLRLNGRGPGGEPIDLSFTATELQARPIMLGVGSNADVRFPDNRSDHRVSRRHAELGHDGRNFTIMDNKSTNHTFIGGRQLAPEVVTSLVNGDVIRLGDIDVTVSID